ncbi:hypothetical protein [Nocardia iowensis]|uniref:Secreted protein n=1 Tax=Nocardia iowensis TaxID=204891 RepID=A0ABX8RI74_NOCIO|nr:hypothetical protein [Nocardia iowensis]QXN89317.1 hypothetical protein KV110_27780 [Nocardia iowensis]
MGGLVVVVVVVVGGVLQTGGPVTGFFVGARVTGVAVGGRIRVPVGAPRVVSIVVGATVVGGVRCSLFWQPAVIRQSPRAMPHPKMIVDLVFFIAIPDQRTLLPAILAAWNRARDVLDFSSPKCHPRQLPPDKRVIAIQLLDVSSVVHPARRPTAPLVAGVT